MRLIRLGAAIGAAAVLLISCKKDNKANADAATSDTGCVSGNSAGNGAIIPGRYIVSYEPATINTRSVTGERMAEISATLLKRHGADASSLLLSWPGEPGGFVANLTVDQVANLRTDSSVSLIEPDRIVALGTCFTVAEPRLLTWGVKRVGYGDGTGKTAWIIDSGIDYDHPDLTVDMTKSKSFLSNNTSFRDENGHGTHVAGIIGAKNNSIGILGVASGANLVALRVLDAGGNGILSSIIQALAYVNTNGKAGDVINLSVGEDTVSQILDQQVQSTASRGIYIAIAAGNDSQPARNYSPGRANGANIFTVAATDSLDRFAFFSNYGRDVVDVAAPGVRILSTFTNGRYAYLSGTSMAAPHVAGLLLLKGRNFTNDGMAKNAPDAGSYPVAHY